jgi:outer membrane protein TolC
MKDLEDWIKQLQISKFTLLTVLFLQLTSFADESLLSSRQEKNIDLSLEKIRLDSSKQKIDWINPINFSYKKNILVPTQDASNFIIPNTRISTISINQPIFKSGGIYNAIKYSNASKKYQSLDINIQKKMLIKDATILLFELLKIDINIKKQNILIDNSNIDIKQKKELIKNHILDISFLNDAIIKLNQNKLQLTNLKIQKEDLLNKFENLTNKSYKSIDVPRLTLVDKDNILNNNLYIKKSQLNEKSQRYMKNITLAKYLPTISILHDYVKYHDRNIDTSTTGLRLTIPLDIKSYYDTQSAKISYLKSKLNTNIVQEEEQNYLKHQLAQISFIDEKIEIQRETINYYNTLLDQIIEEKKHGLKVVDDVTLITNSKMTANLELKIFNIDKQIKLLEIYARTN